MPKSAEIVGRSRTSEDPLELGAVARTDLARAHEELLVANSVAKRRQDLRALGDMCEDVAHGLTGLLDPISTHLQLLDRELTHGDTEAMRASIEHLASAVGQCRKTIGRLREFTRQAPARVAGAVDLDVLASRAVQCASEHLTRHTGVDLRLELGGAGPLSVAPEEAVNALVELIANAIDVTPTGTISVATGTSTDGVWVSVSDDGPGVPHEIQRRLFEPLFRPDERRTGLRPDERRAGLGLAAVYAFVQRYAGTITLTSVPGRGATFRLTFPQATHITSIDVDGGTGDGRGTLPTIPERHPSAFPAAHSKVTERLSGSVRGLPVVLEKLRQARVRQRVPDQLTNDADGHGCTVRPRDGCLRHVEGAAHARSEHPRFVRVVSIHSKERVRAGAPPRSRRHLTNAGWGSSRRSWRLATLAGQMAPNISRKNTPSRTDPTGGILAALYLRTLAPFHAERQRGVPS